MVEPNTITVPVEVKVMIRVGEHDVELGELANALMRAGVSLRALVEPVRMVDTSSYCDPAPQFTEARDPEK